MRRPQNETGWQRGFGNFGAVSCLIRGVADRGHCRPGTCKIWHRTSAKRRTGPDGLPAPPAALLQALKEREAQVQAADAAAQDRMAALDLAEKAIDQRLQELAAAEASLKEVLAIADGAAEQDLARLTAVYEAMKPTDAAALFDAMAPDFAAGFLGRMQPASAAAVMAGMPPEKAYSISALIAGRNANAPKE